MPNPKAPKATLRSIESIQPYGNNPRKGHDLAAIAKSIEAFGWRQPIVVEPNGDIIVGEGRYLAAKQMGLKKVPVHVAEDLTPEQIKAYRIADNQAGRGSTWDLDLLTVEVGALADVDFDLDALGFGEAELADLIGDGDGDGEPTGDAPSNYAAQFGVIVICESEAHQQEVFERLQAEGFECKVVVT